MMTLLAFGAHGRRAADDKRRLDVAITLTFFASAAALPLRLPSV